MAKLLLMSVLIASVALPVIASREKDRAKGARKLIMWMIAFCIFYMIALIHIYPRLEGM